MIPKKLQQGDTIRVIAPSRSLAIISEEIRDIANTVFNAYGIGVTYGTHVEEIDQFVSSTVASRIEDLHDAFFDENVDAIFTAIGGYNSNQLLSQIDFDLIEANPKILCGYSDITILANAIYQKTGLVTYLGPHYSTFGMKHGNEYTIEYMEKCLIDNQPFMIYPSETWSDDEWYMDQEDRVFIENTGYRFFNVEQTIEGIMVGGNLDTFSLLFGTEYMPSLKDKIVLIEDDCLTTKEGFDRHLTSLIQQPEFCDVKALVIGRFQKGSKIDDETLDSIIQTKVELRDVPIITNVDFGHTTPMLTLPIGGVMSISKNDGKIKIVINPN